MERTVQNAQHPENPCFGLSHDPWSPICKRCVLFHLCGTVLGHRIPLDKITFELTPTALFAKDALIEIDDLEINRTNVEDLYRRCYFAVFRKKWPVASNLGKHWKNIVYNAKLSGTSLRSYISIMMAAHSVTRPNTPFYANCLSADTSALKVAKYSKMLKNQYGHDGLAALGLFTHSDTDSIESQLLRSEILAGRWIIGRKMTHDGSAIQHLFKHQELALDEHWLASEQVYIDTVLKPYLDAPEQESAAIKTHRERVLATHSMLKRQETFARSVFSARSQIMPAAVKTVLKHVGHVPENFTHPNSVVTHSLKFWNVLGLAVLHWECLKALQHEPNRLWR